MSEEPTRVVVSECPMSWCTHTAVVEDPEGDYDAALEIQDHVNEDHSEMDIETLKETAPEFEFDGQDDEA